MNRQIRKVIYHWRGKPLTGKPAVALIFSGNTAQLNGRVNGTAKAKKKVSPAAMSRTAVECG
jgi:hypothetical protein